jgi:nucleotide-binding universal stress UspA family protein
LEIPARATANAFHFARCWAGEIILLHVTGHAEPQPSLENSLAHLERELGGGGIARHYSRHADPAQEILRIAITQKTDLIVMATHERWRSGEGWTGQRHFHRFTLTSTVARVVDGGPCPVLVVPPTNTNRRIAHIASLFDTNQPADRASLLAAGLAREFGVKLTLVHAIPSMKIYGPGGGRLADSWDAALCEAATRKMDQFRTEQGCDADTLIGTGPSHTVVPLLAEKAGADLLVAGHHQRRTSRDERCHTFEMIRALPIPILIGNDGVAAQIDDHIVAAEPARPNADIFILLVAALFGVALLAISFFPLRKPNQACIAVGAISCDLRVKPGLAGTDHLSR